MIQAPPAEIIAVVRPQLIRFFSALISMPPDALAGLQVTSWWRSRAINASVGGIPNSFHLWGLALDLVVSDPAHFALHAREAGLDPIDFGSHIHVEPVGSPPPLELLVA